MTLHLLTIQVIHLLKMWDISDDTHLIWESSRNLRDIVLQFPQNKQLRELIFTWKPDQTLEKPIKAHAKQSTPGLLLSMEKKTVNQWRDFSNPNQAESLAMEFLAGKINTLKAVKPSRIAAFKPTDWYNNNTVLIWFFLFFFFQLTV